MKRVLEIIKNPFVVAFLFGVLGIHLVREMNARKFTPPPPLIMVPAWSLIDHMGKPYGTDQLKGKVVIADFMFTRCPTICPKLTESMIKLRKRFLNQGDKAEFLSISIDPEFDTPEVLARFRDQYQTAWPYLTGSSDQIREVVESKMKLPMGNGHHVAELVLFDQRGDLRAKFGTDPTSLAALEKAAKFLIDNP